MAWVCGINMVAGAPYLNLLYGDFLQVQIKLNFQALLVEFYRGGGPLLGSAPMPANPAAWRYYEFLIYVHGTAGEFQCRIDGQAVLTLSGINTKGYASNANINRMLIHSGGGGQAFDDMYLLNDLPGLQGFQGDSRMYGFRPTGDGDTLDWTPNSGTDHYSRVNESPSDGDTSYVSSGTVGHTDLYSGIALPATTGPIVGVQLTSQARKDATGTRSLRHVMKSDGVVGGFPNARALGASYQGFQDSAEAAPATGTPWTRASLNAAQFGLRLDA